MNLRFVRRSWYLLPAAAVLLALGAPALAQHNPSPRPASALSQLLSGQGRAMISQPVNLSDVAVQNITQYDLLWVGTSPDSSVLVMLQPSVNPIDARGNPTPIAEGDQVRVTGHVLRAPDAQTLHSWGVSPADAARVQRQGVVLQANILEVLQRKK